MAYSQYIYQKAKRILDKRRETATLASEKKINEISKKVPELADIQIQLGQIGLSISKVFLSGENTQSKIEELGRKSLKLQEDKKKLLIKNGYSPSDLETKYQCSNCDDTGFIHDKMCPCHIQLLKDLEKEELRKIAPIDDCTFENFKIEYYPAESMDNGVSPRLKAERILENCHKYASTFNLRSPSLMFMGGTGLGKTHLSLAIANVVINRGFSVTYGTAQNIISDLEAEHFGRNTNTTYTERQVLFSDLLILDDLGTEFATSFSASAIYNIINTRILAKRPTIISTNYTFDELENKYDQRATSRISGNYSTLILEGNDIRYIK